MYVVVPSVTKFVYYLIMQIIWFCFLDKLLHFPITLHTFLYEICKKNSLKGRIVLNKDITYDNKFQFMDCFMCLIQFKPHIMNSSYIYALLLFVSILKCFYPFLTLKEMYMYYHYMARPHSVDKNCE